MYIKVEAFREKPESPIPCRASRSRAISDRSCLKYFPKRCKGKWTNLCRAVDHEGKTLDFMLSERRDTAAARRFLKRAIGANGPPDRVVIEKSGANLAGLQSVNVIVNFTGAGRIIKILQVKYLDNIPEQDHRFIKRITGPMLGFKAFHSAAAKIAGIETAQMIRKGQFDANGLTAFQQFAALAV